MQLKLLNEVILIIAGKNAANIVETLVRKKNVNEFQIAKKLNLTINQTRNILYKLSDYGLVTFTRRKDKKKAWYTYFWTLNIEKCLELLEKMTLKDIEQSKKQLETRRNKRFYICKTCNIELSEETALVNDFTCPECGEAYKLNTDKKLVSDLEIKISRLEKNLEIIREELRKVREKAEKGKRRKLAKKNKKQKIKKTAKKAAKKKIKKRKRKNKRKKKK